MGAIPLLQERSDGTAVMVVGRGGGHGPPESPHGISMIRVSDGSQLWSLELPKFSSTQNFSLVGDEVVLFHAGEHLWVDAMQGKVIRRVSIVDNIPVCRNIDGSWQMKTESIANKKSRALTQGSNLLAGNYHYFRSYTRNYLGRVDVVSGKAEYLELPLSVLREPGKDEQILWPTKDSGGKIGATIKPNSMINSRGLKVMGDKRATNSGWGHITAPIPSLIGDRLLVPLMSGVVFSIKVDAPVLEQGALVSINDLGPLGEAWTRASISTDGKVLYAHTIKEVIAIGSAE